MLIRRLSETDNIVHRLLDFQTELMISEVGNDTVSLLAQLLSRLTKVSLDARNRDAQNRKFSVLLAYISAVVAFCLY